MDSDLMTGPWLAALLAVLVGVGVAAAGVLAMLRARARSRQALERVLAETEQLRREVDELRAATASRGPGRPGPHATGESAVPYVITQVDRSGAGPGGPPATLPTGADGRIEGRLFVDLVVRESVAKAAALGQGVRRGLAPESRNRIRFEMGREVKRARRQRRADLREARRRLHAEQRGGQGPAVGDATDPGLRREGAA